MIDSKVIRYGLALLISTSVAGCLGNDNSSIGSASNQDSVTEGNTEEPTGGNTDTSDSTDTDTDTNSNLDGTIAVNTAYSSEFDRITGLAPTTDMPTALQASYTGQMMAVVTGPTEIVGEIVADLNLDVSWIDGQASNPFSGGASNFQGRLEGGSFEPIAGTLAVDSSLPGTIIRQEIGGENIAGFDIPPTQTGTMLVHLSGELTQEKTVDTTVQLGGNFFGSGASAATGAVTGGFSDPADGSPAIFDGGIGGTYYLEAK